MLTQRRKGAEKLKGHAEMLSLCAVAAGGTNRTAPLREILRILLVTALLVGTPRLYAQNAAPLIKRVDDATRAKLLAALAGLVILGFGLVLLVWLGARITDRYRRGTSYFRPTPRPGEHDWAKKPLVPGDTKTDRKK